MATQRITHTGKGTLERTRVIANNTEAQCSLDASVFPNGCEVGSIVAVDKPAGKVKLSGDLKGILANTERNYNQYQPGLKDFYVKGGQEAVVLFLTPGEEITTNTVSYDTTEYASEELLIAALDNASSTPLYGKQDATDGAIQVTATKGTCPFQVVKRTTMPDGQMGVKFICIGEL